MNPAQSYLHFPLCLFFYPSALILPLRCKYLNSCHQFFSFMGNYLSFKEKGKDWRKNCVSPECKPVCLNLKKTTINMEKSCCFKMALVCLNCYHSELALASLCVISPRVCRTIKWLTPIVLKRMWHGPVKGRVSLQSGTEMLEELQKTLWSLSVSSFLFGKPWSMLVHYKI